MNHSFINITEDNLKNFKKLKRIYLKYKIKTLKNHGEKHISRKWISNLFCSSIKNDQFIFMNYNNKLLGFAVITISSNDMIDIPYEYGIVKDFYISQKFRRRGYGKILNNYIEDIFVLSEIDTVLLYPDTITGLEFWKAMGYEYTGIHNGRGEWKIYIKTLRESTNANNIKKAIDKFVVTYDR